MQEALYVAPQLSDEDKGRLLLISRHVARAGHEAALKNIKWYPAVPAGIEDIEGRVLDRVKAAN